MSHRPSLLATAVVLLAALGCQRGASRAEPPASPPAARATPASQPASAGPVAGGGHDPAHPAIDCPLRQAGIAHDSLRPFEDVAKYIAHLERPDRAAWQRPDAVVAALGLRGRETVVDVGAGSGYFSFRLAKALPRGKVVATDIEPEMIRHIHHRAMTTGVQNLQAVLGKPDDPGVPRDADLVFMCDVLHHVRDRAAWLGKLAAQMKPGAKLVLVEFKEGKLPQGPPEAMKIPRGELVKVVTAAGLVLDGEKPGLLPYQHLLVFRRP